MNNYLKSIKSISDGSNKLVTWSLSVTGGTILIIINDSYIHPSCIIIKSFYLLFVVGWILLAFSINNGIRISGRLMAAKLFASDEAKLKEIFEKVNDDFGYQLKLFKWALIVFGVWLILYLIWWVTN